MDPTSHKGMASRMKGRRRDDHCAGWSREPGNTITTSTPPHSMNSRIKGMTIAKGGKTKPTRRGLLGKNVSAHGGQEALSRKEGQGAAGRRAHNVGGQGHQIKGEGAVARPETQT